MHGALNQLELAVHDDMTWAEMNECYASFLASVVHEFEVLMRNGSFSSEAEFEEFLSDYVETLPHVYEPSKSTKYMSLTRNREAVFSEVNAYTMATDSRFWYQAAFFAQVADFKDEFGLAGLYSWFRSPRDNGAEAYSEEDLTKYV